MPKPARKLDLYMAHRAALIDYASSISGGRSQAEDVVQEAWLKFEGGPQHTQIRNPVNYLYRIVRNLALDLTRRPAHEQPQADSSLMLNDMAASTPSPETQICDQDSLQVIADALAELPERTRIAFEMHRFGDYTLQHIARHLGISVGQAHKLVRDALSHCAERLGDEAQ